MSSAYNKVYAFVAEIGDGAFNLNSDSIYIALYNTAPTTATTAYSNTNELASGNGYTTAGSVVGSTAYSQTSGLATLTGSNVVWTATGSMGPFRYALIYDSTSASKYALGWWDYGSSVTLTSGETFTVNLASGILTLQ